MTSRRDALRVLAVTSAATAAASAQTSHANHEPEKESAPVAPLKARFFSDAEMPLLTRLTDLIIPRTDTPGAADAGVALLIDQSVGGNAERGELLRSGIKQLPPDFLTQTEAQQVALLRKLEAEKSPFFKALKGATIDFYYSTPQGLQQELGWHGNTVLLSFPGCTHPEHQV